MAMDRLIAEYFGNNVKTASAEVDPSEQEKVAQMEIFTKLAADQGIDLEKLSEDQIAHLWNHVFSKEASAEEEKEKESEGDPAEAKKEEAKKEHEEKKEAMAKMAEATFLGKVMAHSLVAELREISKEASVETDPGETQEGENKEAAMPPQLAKALGKGKELAGKAGKAVAGAADKGGKKLEHLGKKVTEKATGVGASNMKPSHAKGVGAATVGAGAAAAGAAAHHFGKKKESSAIDELALVEAVKIAEAAGFNTEEAANRVSGVFHLGMLGESEKVASATDHEAAIQVRALEFLEAAGYPVTWES